MIAYNYSEPRGLHKSVNQAELRDSYYERGKFMTMKRKYWPLAVAGILAVSAAGCQNTGMESAAASSVAVQESAASTAAAAETTPRSRPEDCRSATGRARSCTGSTSMCAPGR